jgi:hypothetical protein
MLKKGITHRRNVDPNLNTIILITKKAAAILITKQAAARDLHTFLRVRMACSSTSSLWRNYALKEQGKLSLVLQEGTVLTIHEVDDLSFVHVHASSARSCFTHIVEIPDFSHPIIKSPIVVEIRVKNWGAVSACPATAWKTRDCSSVCKVLHGMAITQSCGNSESWRATHTQP